MVNLFGRLSTDLHEKDDDPNTPAPALAPDANTVATNVTAAQEPNVPSAAALTDGMSAANPTANALPNSLDNAPAAAQQLQVGATTNVDVGGGDSAANVLASADVTQADNVSPSRSIAPTESLDTGNSRMVSPSEIQAAQAGLFNVQNLGLSPLASAGDPHTYYLPVVFDGTDNNIYDSSKVATNPGLFDSTIFPTTSSSLPPIYEQGLGTQSEGILGEGFGLGGKGRESDALQQVGQNMQAIYEKDPNAQIILIGVGFSRGSLEARDFANQVYDQGVPIPGTTDPTTGAPQYYSGAQAPRFGALVIYDTVGSYGLPGTDLNPGYNETIAPNVEHVLQITANDESRSLFPLSSATDQTDTSQFYNDGRIVQLGLPGAHSDIGGGYPGAYQYYGLDAGYSFLSQLGVPANPLTAPDNSYDFNVDNYSSDSMRLHDSRFAIDKLFQFLHLESTGRTVYPVNNPPYVGPHQ